MEFPQYRKLSNNKSFYRIDSKDRFVEVQVIGQRRFAHDIEAKKYPELLRIQDMINFEIPDLLESNESEFNEQLLSAVTV